MDSTNPGPRMVSFEEFFSRVNKCIGQMTTLRNELSTAQARIAQNHETWLKLRKFNNDLGNPIAYATLLFINWQSTPYGQTVVDTLDAIEAIAGEATDILQGLTALEPQA